MHYYLVAPTTRLHRSGYFTYHSLNVVGIGTIVAIEVGKKTVVGVVVKQVKKPNFVTKPITRQIENRALPSQLVAVAQWLEQYYAAPASAVWQTILPRGIEKKRRLAVSEKNTKTTKKPSFHLSADQQAAVKSILSQPTTTSLLQGITGSGKTAVYIELAKKTLQQDNRSVIVLVPEIALTSQLIKHFSAYFKNILVTHSGMTEAQRHTVWLTALNSRAPRVVVGPRSALFMPLKKLGLIVIDEAHEPSFKQDQSPRYSALRLAKVLAKQHKAQLVLGSATPSVSDRYIAEKTKANIVRLATSAKKIGNTSVMLIDSRLRHNFTRHRFFSTQLLKAIDGALEAKQQVLLFHNRRGSASSTLCEKCGWQAICPHCFVPFVLHADIYKLVCHVCGQRHAVPSTCPECHHVGVIHKGIGTKTINDEISKLFPQARVARFDGDSLKNEGLDARYNEIYKGEVDIIIGTQIVAKGLDLPNLSLVGVVQADGGLALPDFATDERVFQLLYQVMGRVGRDEKLSTIVIQSFQPDHFAIQTALKKDYESFYKQTVAKRHHDGFPPFTHLLRMVASYKSEAAAVKASRQLLKTLQLKAPKRVKFFGPAPAFYERVRGNYRWQIVAKSPKRDDLVRLLSHVPPTKWQTDLDPMSLL